MLNDNVRWDVKYIFYYLFRDVYNFYYWLIKIFFVRDVLGFWKNKDINIGLG